MIQRISRGLSKLGYLDEEKSEFPEDSLDSTTESSSKSTTRTSSQTELISSFLSSAVFSVEHENKNEKDVDNNDQASILSDEGSDVEIENLDRLSMRLDGLEAYVLVGLWISTSCFSDLVIGDFQQREGSLPTFMRYGVILCGLFISLFGLYSTVVFATTILYGKTAVGLSRDKEYLMFMHDTGKQRGQAFQLLVNSMFAYAVMVCLVSVNELSSMNILINGIVVVTLGCLVYVGATNVRAILSAAAPIYAPPPQSVIPAAPFTDDCNQKIQSEGTQSDSESSLDTEKKGDNFLRQSRMSMLQGGIDAANFTKSRKNMLSGIDSANFTKSRKRITSIVPSTLLEESKKSSSVDNNLEKFVVEKATPPRYDSNNSALIHRENNSNNESSIRRMGERRSVSKRKPTVSISADTTSIIIEEQEEEILLEETQSDSDDNSSSFTRKRSNKKKRKPVILWMSANVINFAAFRRKSSKRRMKRSVSYYQRKINNGSNRTI